LSKSTMVLADCASAEKERKWKAREIERIIHAKSIMRYVDAWMFGYFEKSGCFIIILYIAIFSAHIDLCAFTILLEMMVFTFYVSLLYRFFLRWKSGEWG
jgi:hypothetical protein